MAALVKVAPLVNWQNIRGIPFSPAVKVADAVETDLSTPDTSIEIDTTGVRMLAMQIKFANYTSVAVKIQRSLDGGTSWDDLHTALSVSADSVVVNPEAPLCRLSIAGTLSASADTLEVWLYAEGHS